MFASFWAVGGILWAAAVGLQAMRGHTDWLLDHLPLATRAAVGLTALGIAFAFLLRPAWAGLAMAYGMGVVAVAARWLHRSLERARALGGLELPPPERRAEILRRAGAGLLALWAGVTMVGVADLLWWRGWPALFDFLAAAAVLGLAAAYRREARTLVG